jgi:uroporphyrinogen-III synthase
MTAAGPPAGSLAGRRIVTTRDERGRFEELLERAGAEPVHVPLIAVVDAPELVGALATLDRYDWLVVTSRHGAARAGAAARAHARLRLAAVGTRTAAVLAELAGREVDVVPERQTAADLVAAMPPSAADRVLVAQADRAAATLVDGLRASGFVVDAVVAYRTELRRPTAAERAAVLGADAVAFASGSAAQAWADAFGSDLPPIAVAIGPSTASVARERGLQITHVAADHSLDGLVEAVAGALAGVP